MRHLILEDMTQPGIPGHEEAYDFICYCKHCGSELVFSFKYTEFEYKARIFDNKKRLEKALKELKEYEELDRDPWPQGMEAHRAEVRRRLANYKETVEQCRKQLEKDVPNSERAAATAVNAKEAYYNAMQQSCPVCGMPLIKELGYFMPAYLLVDKYYDKFYDKEIGKPKGENLIEKRFSHMTQIREKNEAKKRWEQVDKFVKANDLPVSVSSSLAAEMIQKTPEDLKKYVSALIQLENNIYSLKQRLPVLYDHRLRSDRRIMYETYAPVFIAKQAKQEQEKSREALLKKTRRTYQNALDKIEKARHREVKVSVVYPREPSAPVLEKPGLFNRKRVLAENEALTAKYQAEMRAYHEKCRQCDEKKARLIQEKRAAAVEEAQQKAAAAKAALDEAEAVVVCDAAPLAECSVQTMAAKDLLDREIAETEGLLKKSLSARNELYACDVIFGKYRNVVALSSFYEYLMSGRCSALDGVDGAYNIYENEIRMNRVIDQLDTVIASLEEIKQNQYMMYQEMQNIHTSLDTLNSTMTAALNSILHIKDDTTHMSETLDHISQNSSVIAYNTAVTAYYSKINADLTNALGYMVAFK